MPAILKLPELRERVTQWTVSDYEKLVEQGLAPKHGELIRGIIIDKMSKPPLHADLCDWLRDEMRRQLPEAFKVSQERPLKLADSEPEPDLSVFQGVRMDFQREHATTALLVVAVAGSSTLADREYAFMYAEAAIPEYWIVLAGSQQIEVYRRPQAGIYQEVQVYGEGELLTCQSLPNVSISLKDLFS